MKPQIQLLKKCSFNNKYIYISPGGIKGFYMLGVISYIKNNYDISDYQVIGSSAGAWNTIPFTLTNDELNDKFLNEIFSYFENVVENKQKISLYNIQKDIKGICEKCEKIEYHKINIVSNNLSLRGFRPVLINNFSNMDDVTNYCIASSHIPYLTGNILCRINKKLYFDGGLFKKSINRTINPYFCIDSSMWGYDFKKLKFNPLNRKHLYYYKHFYNQGYNDSCKNKEELDKIFLND
tara:strand:- start:7546 stop:8256 length:711 start_codon:yes stop_codon:yes gene_type:complete